MMNRDRTFSQTNLAEIMLLGIVMMALILYALFAVADEVAPVNKPVQKVAQVMVATHAGKPVKVAAANPVYYKNEVVVLMFHNVSAYLTGRGTITPQQLDEDMANLQEKGYHIIPMSQMAAWLDGNEVVPDNAVVLTFDDGYSGVYDYALPILKKHRAHATVYVIAGLVGKRDGILTWPEVRALEASKLVSIGGHTYNEHFRVPTGPDLHHRPPMEPATVARIYNLRTKKTESDNQYQKRMIYDTRLTQQLLRQKLGHTTPYFAYPYGAYTPSYIKILQADGYRYICMVLNGINTQKTDHCHIFRVNAGMPMFTPARVMFKIQFATLTNKLPRTAPEAWIPRI
jgi:biofilm PGA synthesis lipoprotein PgaB